MSSPALSTTLTAAPYSLPVLADLRTNAFTSTVDVYQYEFDNYASLTTHRLITGLELTIPDYLRDYAVATQAMMVWLDPDTPDQEALLEQFLALMEPNSPYLGWWTDEGAGVQTASTYGVPVVRRRLVDEPDRPRRHAARRATPPPPPPPPPLENKLYVAIFMSDGDNLQEDEGLIPLKWADTNRGNVPDQLDDRSGARRRRADHPPVLPEHRDRRTTSSSPVPRVSGTPTRRRGPTSMFDSYTKLSGRYLTTAGLDVITLWNNNVDLSAANAQSYATNIPSLVGMTIQADSVARQWVTSSLPVNLLAVTYAPAAEQIETGPPGPGLTPSLAAYNGSQPYFAAVQGDMNYSTITPSAFLDIRNYYANNSNVVFVRGRPLLRAHGPCAQPPCSTKLFTGDVNGDGKTDAFFYYGGDGNEWIGLSDGTNLNWSNGGNISDFGNLLDGTHEFFTGDFNGDGKTDFAFYYSGDNSVWLGTSAGTAFTWAQISTTTLGNWLDGAHRVHVADYNGDGKADFSVYDNASGANGTVLD